MKKIIFSLAILNLFSTGCRERSEPSPDVISRQHTYTDSLFTSEVQQFALPYPDDFKPDSSTLIFFGSRPFDTSFLLQLKVTSSEIVGVYYQVLPAFHNDTYNYASEVNKLLFFEGYSFVLNQSNWKKITDQTIKLLADSTNLDISNACRDCAVYGLAYNDKKNIGNNLKYGGFYGYLKDLFLTEFIKKRKPIMWKDQ